MLRVFLSSSSFVLIAFWTVLESACITFGFISEGIPNPLWVPTLSPSPPVFPFIIGLYAWPSFPKYSVRPPLKAKSGWVTVVFTGNVLLVYVPSNPPSFSLTFPSNFPIISLSLKMLSLKYEPVTELSNPALYISALNCEPDGSLLPS